MTAQTIYAYTPSRVTQQGLVPFVNLSRLPDGTHQLLVRHEDGSGRQAHINLPWDVCLEMARAILERKP
jgi:hypothetical protein